MRKIMFVTCFIKVRLEVRLYTAERCVYANAGEKLIVFPEMEVMVTISLEFRAVVSSSEL